MLAPKRKETPYVWTAMAVAWVDSPDEEHGRGQGLHPVCISGGNMNRSFNYRRMESNRGNRYRGTGGKRVAEEADEIGQRSEPEMLPGAPRGHVARGHRISHQNVHKQL